MILKNISNLESVSKQAEILLQRLGHPLGFAVGQGGQQSEIQLVT